jgi:hypothetical protein
MHIAQANLPFAMRSTRTRSFGAVFAGLIVVAALSHATDAALRQAGIFSSYGEPMRDPLYLLAFVYRSAFGVLGAYIAARLAATSGMRHALILGGLGTVLSALGVLASAGHPELGPSWYPIALTVCALPSGWLGGALATRTSK